MRVSECRTRLNLETLLLKSLLPHQTCRLTSSLYFLFGGVIRTINVGLLVSFVVFSKNQNHL